MNCRGGSGAVAVNLKPSAPVVAAMAVSLLVRRDRRSHPGRCRMRDRTPTTIHAREATAEGARIDQMT